MDRAGWCGGHVRKAFLHGRGHFLGVEFMFRDVAVVIRRGAEIFNVRGCFLIRGVGVAGLALAALSLGGE